MSMKNVVRLTTLAVAPSLLALPALAQWGPEEEKNCFTKGEGGSLTLSAQGGSGLEDSSKLQQYETFPKGVFVPCAAFSWKNENYFIDVLGTKLGLDDQFASLVGGKKGGFELHLGWDQNPNWQSNTARTPYSEVSPGVFHVPDGMRLALQNVYVPWVPPTADNPVGTGNAPANPTVPGYYAVEPWVADSFPIDLRYLRKTGAAGFNVPVGEAFVFDLTFSRETRDGNKNTTFYGGPSYEVATPIDFRTDNLHLSGEYAKDRLFFSASADFSSFRNDLPFVEIDNPERLELQNPANGQNVINDVSFFRLWMPPDNKAYQVDLTGGVTLPARHKVTGSLSTGEMTMDMSLLPISTNPNLATSATDPNPSFTIIPPYGDIAAQFDTFMGQLKLTGDPIPWFGYILSWRKFDLTDKTDEYHFNSTVRGDVRASYSSSGFTREHQGWGSDSLRAEVHFRPTAGLRLNAQFAEEKRHYDSRSYADVKDNVFTLSADYTRDWMTLHGAWTSFDRKPGAAGIPPEFAGTTQTDISQRNRHIWSGLVTLTPTSRFTVALTGQTQSNEFAESVTGLRDQSFDTFGVDATYMASAKLSVFAGYVYEKYFVKMAAAYFKGDVVDPANLWENDTNDKVDTFRAGVDWVLVPDKFDFNATFDYTKPRSDSRYLFALPGTPIGGLNEANGIFPSNVPPIPGFPVTTFDRFPLVTKSFVMAKLRLAYHVSKNLTASAMYWKQKYDNTDWQTDLMQPYMGRVDPGSNRWFFLGAQVPSYDANVFRASVTYTF
jgi:Putative outer membrane beta-barrel porin, MtrB/PioB